MDYITLGRVYKNISWVRRTKRPLSYYYKVFIYNVENKVWKSLLELQKRLDTIYMELISYIHENDSKVIKARERGCKRIEIAKEISIV